MCAWLCTCLLAVFVHLRGALSALCSLLRVELGLAYRRGTAADADADDDAPPPFLAPLGPLYFTLCPFLPRACRVALGIFLKCLPGIVDLG